ncbi:uncharacterized protein LOC143888640 [Tasmannia lanceolata]|uniref:uncharacterized protein LOC143888640 n=1 Tax=Tasmannia lanceolata TaxID=3420 RepID=UPI00406332A3
MSQVQEEGVIEAQDSHQQVASEPQEETSSKTKKKRGPTKLDYLYKMEGRFTVTLNAYKQVVGKNAGKCGKFLGIIAKTGTLLPIDVFSWKNMPESNKEDAWSALLEKFDVPKDGKDWAMIQLNEKWKDHKYQLRRKYFNETSDEVIFPPQPNKIVESQYIKLWEHWKSDEFKAQRTKNTLNRNQSWTPHTGGSKAFAVITEEMEEKTKKSYGRDELWIMTRTHSDGTFVENSRDAIAKIRELQETQPMESSQCNLGSKDDILSKALGPDKHGRVRCLGPGSTPSSLWGKKPRRETSSKSRCEVLEKELAAMKEEMRQMKDIFMQNGIIGGEQNSPNQLHSSVASRID